MESCASNFKMVSKEKSDTERVNSLDGNKPVNPSDRFKKHMSFLRSRFCEDYKNIKYSENPNEYSQKDILSLDKGSVCVNDKDSKSWYSGFRNNDSDSFENPMTVIHDVNNFADNDAEKLAKSMALLDITSNAEYLKLESSFGAPQKKQSDVCKKKIRPKIYSECEVSSKSPEMFSTVFKPQHQKKSGIQFQTGDYNNKLVQKNYKRRNNRGSFKSPQFSARDSDDEEASLKFKTAEYKAPGGIKCSSECSATCHHHQSKKFVYGYSKHGRKMESHSSKHYNHEKRLSAAERNVIEILNSARTFKTAEPTPINNFDGAGVNCFKKIDNSSDADDKPKNTPPPGGFVAVKPYTSADLAASQPNIIWSELWELDEEW